MYDNTAGILNYRGSGVQNTCRIFSSYHSGVENTCRIFMQYPSVVQNTCRIVISHLSAVRNTAVLSQLRCVPGCRGVLNTPLQTALRGRMMVMLWDVWGDGGWEYGHVFATNGWRLWGVCNTPLHVLHAIHRNTAMFFERGTRYPSKYERVSRTGCTLRIEIRKCFSNRVHVIHQNTETFSEGDTRYPSKYRCVF